MATRHWRAFLEMKTKKITLLFLILYIGSMNLPEFIKAIETMYPDGICKVTENRYSRCIAFSDINYQLAGADEKTEIGRAHV